MRFIVNLKLWFYKPPNILCLISFVDSPDQLPESEQAEMRRLGIEWEDVNFQVKRILSARWAQDADGDWQIWYK